MSRPQLPLTSFVGLAAWSPAEAVTRLAALSAALPACDDPHALAELARSAPERVAPLAPEVCLAVCDVVLTLVEHAPRLPVDVDRLEPRLRCAWQRVALAAADDRGPADRLTDRELLPVVHGWNLDEVLAPLTLLRRLASAADARLRERLLAWIHPAVHTLALGPAEAVALLLPLAADAEPAIRGRALALLAEPWVRGLSPAQARDREAALARGVLDEDPAVARVAVAAAAALDRRDWLLALVLPGGDAPARVDAVEALGPLAQADDLAPVLALAAADPLRHGPAVRRVLLAAHRHGTFLRAHHLDDLLAAFDAHPPWTGDEIARVTHIVRAELVQRVAELAPDDPRWIRRADILAASVDPQAPALLRDLLGRVRDLDVAAALIAAAGRSPDYTDEAPLLAWLDRLPEVALPVLRCKGGAAAEARLRALAVDPHTPPGLRASALDVLWTLAGDRQALLHDLAAALGPHESGLLRADRRSPRDRGVAALVVAAPWSDEPAHALEPAERFAVLCESGDPEHRARVVELFREQVRELVRQALAGDFAIKRVALPELEQQLFRYGRHLAHDGRRVRGWIEPAPETGRDLVLQVAIDWLRESPSPAVSVALLETIARHAPGPAVLRMIEPWWRHREREVRRAAIEAILAAGEGARGLELSLCRLAADDEPRILSQALAAVAGLGAAWAEPIVLAALDRPEMAVKKDAAAALGSVAGGRSIATLVEWLAHHDNRGLRELLLAALARAAGPALVAVLVDALGHETEARRVDLLIDALGGRLPLAAAVRLARSPRPAHQRLLAACLAGQVTLVDADVARLTARLRRARLIARPERPDPGRALRREGFTVEAARALLDARDSEAEVLVAVRGALAEWIAWLRAGDSPAPRALALVLDAAQPGHAEHLEALLDLAERHPTLVDPTAVVAMLERCLAGRGLARALEVRAVALLRGLPPAPGLGLRRFRALARLGAVRTRGDLERCLGETRLGPDLARDSAALLEEALALPAARLDEPPDLTDLREQVRRWHALEPSMRAAWLTAALDERPLDLPRPPAPAEAPRPRFQPASRADLADLLVSLREADVQERTRAAARLLAWPDAASLHPQVLDAHLHGRVELTADQRAQVAPLLARWPTAPEPAERALALLPHLPPHHLRRFVAAWVAAFFAGEPAAVAPLRSVDPELVLPHAVAAAAADDFRLLQFLRPGPSLALRTLVAAVAARDPEAVAHLMPAADDPPPTAADPEDPIAGRGPDELLAVIDDPRAARGLAVRAVHALAGHGEPGVPGLERLVEDPRPPVRSAALRALRAVAPRPVALAAAARALAMETRADVVLSLMKSLGHARHEPALPALLGRLEHRDPRLHEGARQALLGWGPAVIPALRRAARHARPDRRPIYAALIADLEQLDA